MLEGFDAISAEHGFYRRSATHHPPQQLFPLTGRGQPHGRGPSPVRLEDLGGTVASEVFKEPDLTAVLIDATHRVLFEIGPVSRHLLPPPAESAASLVSRVSPVAAPALTEGLQRAARTGEAVHLAGLPLGCGETTHPATVTVQPVSSPALKAPLLLVSFREGPEGTPASPSPPAAGAPSLLWRLEAALLAARAQLLAAVARLNDSNEDLVAAREALRSTSQELHCADEELGCDSNDLRSACLRLEEKVAELEAMNTGLAALLDGTDVATLFVDTSLCLRRLNPAATRLLGLTAVDVGQSLPGDAPYLADAGLAADVAPVLRDSLPREADVHTADGRWLVRRTTLCRTPRGDVAGVTVTFTEETARKQEAEHCRLLATALMAIPDAFILHDFEGHILAWNRGAERLYGYTEDEAKRTTVDLIIPEELRGEARAHWRQLERGEAAERWETQRVTRDGRRLDVWGVTTVVRDAAGVPLALAKVDRDVSDIKRTVCDLATLQSQPAADLSAMKQLHEFSTRLVHAGSVEELLEKAMTAAVEITSADRGVMHVIEPGTGTMRIATQRGFDRPYLDYYARVVASEFERAVEEHGGRLLVEDVRTSPVFEGAPEHRDVLLGAGVRAFQATPLYSRAGRLVGVITTHYDRPHLPSDRELRLFDLLGRQVADLLERTEAELELRRSREALRRSNETLEQRVAARTAELRDEKELCHTILNTAITGIVNFDRRGTVRQVNPAAERLFGYTADELIGKNVSLLLPEFGPGELARLIRDDPARGAAAAHEVRGVRKNGTDIPLALAVNRVDSRDLYTGILLDLSRGRELEREVVRIAAQEQHRIGQYLHDDCGQQLTALSLLTDGLVDALKPTAPKQAQAAQRLADGLRALLRKVRYISHGLALSEVEPENLPLALQELAAQINEAPDVRCECHIDLATPVRGTNTATQLYHVAQEACTNALKHGKPSSVRVSLEVNTESLILSITDDGVGLPEITSAGLGLRIMRNRANLIGASLVVERLQAGGTRVVCTARQGPARVPAGEDSLV